MSINSPQNLRHGNKGNKNDSETPEEHKDTVSSPNVSNAVEKCLKIINSNMQMLMVCHDLLKKYIINISTVKTVQDLVYVKNFLDEYKNIVNEMIFNTDRLIELVRECLDEFNEVLKESQRKRNEIEECLNRVSLQSVIIEDASRLYFLTEFNDHYLYSTKQFEDTTEMLIKSHNLGAASLNTINETPLNNEKLSINREDKKKEHESQRNRALEAYNQYIIIAFPILTKTNAIGASRGNSQRQRRLNIPERPQNTVNMWSVMKNSIGKDLTRIPMPVNFSEPISALQRLVECFEYSHILDRAAVCGDALEQLAYVAAFYVSGYSTNSNRKSKPFNPLLGETFEWDRTDDYGWRVITEQVSHHPPISALHCAGKEWTCWEEFSVVTKFRGRYLTAEPSGTVHLEFNKRDGHRYTWKKVSSTIHNIVIGKMYVEQNGEIDVIDHTNGAKCHLNFLPSGGYFGRDCKNRVFGTVKDTSGIVKWMVDGVWDKYVEIGLVTSVEGPSEKPVYKTDSKTVVWECTPLPANSEKQYNFTLFARQLNEMEEEVAPTDSRRRPDQRLMEEGNWDEANVVKVLLEQKQRERTGTRRSSMDSTNEVSDDQRSAARSATGSTHHQPVWFKQQVDTLTRETMYVYQNGYWQAKQKQDWSMCPANIFNV